MARLIGIDSKTKKTLRENTYNFSQKIKDDATIFFYENFIYLKKKTISINLGTVKGHLILTKPSPTKKYYFILLCLECECSYNIWN